MALWKFCNIDILQSLKSRDRLLRRKFKKSSSEPQWPWPWPWIRSKSYWCAYPVEIYPCTHQIRWKLEKLSLWTDVRTYGPLFQSIRSLSLHDDLKINLKGGGRKVLGQAKILDFKVGGWMPNRLRRKILWRKIIICVTVIGKILRRH